MLQFLTELTPFLDLTIVILAIILLYLLLTRVFLVNWALPAEDELETMQLVTEEKAKQAKELTSENQFLQEKIKQTKQKYMKRKIDASTYKNLIVECKERITQNEARLQLLQK